MLRPLVRPLCRSRVWGWPPPRQKQLVEALQAPSTRSSPTLEAAVAKLDELQKAARRLRGETDRHIRPILLVRVERTGKDQRDKTTIHAEDAREYLVAKLGAKPEEIW